MAALFRTLSFSRPMIGWRVLVDRAAYGPGEKLKGTLGVKQDNKKPVSGAAIGSDACVCVQFVGLVVATYNGKEFKTVLFEHPVKIEPTNDAARKASDSQQLPKGEFLWSFETDPFPSAKSGEEPCPLASYRGDYCRVEYGLRLRVGPLFEDFIPVYYTGSTTPAAGGTGDAKEEEAASVTAVREDPNGGSLELTAALPRAQLNPGDPLQIELDLKNTSHKDVSTVKVFFVELVKLHHETTTRGSVHKLQYRFDKVAQRSGSFEFSSGDLIVPLTARPDAEAHGVSVRHLVRLVAETTGAQSAVKRGAASTLGTLLGRSTSKMSANAAGDVVLDLPVRVAGAVSAAWPDEPELREPVVLPNVGEAQDTTGRQSPAHADDADADLVENVMMDAMVKYEKEREERLAKDSGETESDGAARDHRPKKGTRSPKSGFAKARSVRKKRISFIQQPKSTSSDSGASSSPLSGLQEK